MIDFVAFFTGDSLSYLKLFPLPFSALDYLFVFFFFLITAAYHHITS